MAERVPAAKRSQRGVALIAVLAFLAVMSLLAISVVGASRTAIGGATRHLARVQAQASVEGAANFAIAELVAARSLTPLILAQPREWQIGGYKVDVAARRESAKVDLNFADVVLLMGMFREAGADADQASALASAVQDWRDADDLLHVNGAEAREYEAAGLKYGPKNKLFESVEELRFVLGVTDAIFACLRPDVTVFGRTSSVDLQSASPLVRRAAGVVSDGQTAAPAGQSVVSAHAIGAGEVFEVVARIDDQVRRIRRAERIVVRITGNLRDPYWTLSAEPADPMLDAAKRSCPAVPPK